MYTQKIQVLQVSSFLYLKSLVDSRTSHETPPVGVLVQHVLKGDEEWAPFVYRQECDEIAAVGGGHDDAEYPPAAHQHPARVRPGQVLVR